MQNLKNISKLNKFVNHNIQISMNNISFNYRNFFYSLENETLTLTDLNNENNKTTVHSFDIKEISNINNDLYSDIITIYFNNNNFIKLNCIESKPVYPRCKKCNKEIIVPEESIFYISGYGNYGSRYEGTKVSLPICDDCLHEFIGDIEDEFDILQNQMAEEFEVIQNSNGNYAVVDTLADYIFSEEETEIFLENFSK